MYMHIRTALLVGAIAMPVGLTQAQTTGMDQSDRQRDAAQTNQRQSGQTTQGQQGNTQTTQGQMGQATQGQARGMQGSQQRADSQTQQHLIQMLQMGNQAEIELAQLASQRAQDERVKQFAERMQQDHQRLMQQLERVAPGTAMSDRSGTSGQMGSQQASRDSGSSTGRHALSDIGSSDDRQTTGDMGTSMERQARSEADRTTQELRESGGLTSTTGSTDGASSAMGGATATENRERGASAGPNARIGDRDPQTGAGADLAEASRRGELDTARSGTAGSGTSSSGMADASQREAGDTASQVYGFAAGGQSGGLAQVMREYHQQHMQSTRQMLSEKQGTEFDKAYMGHQIMMHQGTLDKLQVFSRHVDQDTQQVLQQSQQTVRQHLEEARQIMEQLDRS